MLLCLPPKTTIQNLVHINVKLRLTVLSCLLISQSALSDFYGTAGIGYSNSSVFGRIATEDNENYIYNSFLSSLSVGYRMDNGLAAELNGVSKLPFQRSRLPELNQIRLNTIYYFNDDTFRPYILLGVGRASIHSAEPLELNSSGLVWGGGIGIEYTINERWFTRANLRLDQAFDDSRNNDESYEFINTLFEVGYNFGTKSSYKQDSKFSDAKSYKVYTDQEEVDSDKDGIPDSIDLCPDTPASKPTNEVGCAIIGVTDSHNSSGIIFEGILDVNFDSGSSVLKEQARITLNKMSDILKKHSEIKIFVQAHTDNIGSDKENLKLSKSRAESVKNYLESRGISSARIVEEGYGETYPIATNKTAEGRALNRRVVFKLVEYM